MFQTVCPNCLEMIATPKQEELVTAKFRHSSKRNAELFFLDGLSSAIANMVQQSSGEIPVTNYYAFEQSEINQERMSWTGSTIDLQAVVMPDTSDDLQLSLDL